MIKALTLVVVLAISVTEAMSAERIKCQDAILPTDVIAQDYDDTGNTVEYKRNSEDIAKVIDVLRTRIAQDPSIIRTVGWEDRMLTTHYWAKERCGGTKDCSTKECPDGNSCVYRSLGMSGCRCEKNN